MWVSVMVLKSTTSSGVSNSASLVRPRSDLVGLDAIRTPQIALRERKLSILRQEMAKTPVPNPAVLARRIATEAKEVEQRYNRLRPVRSASSRIGNIISIACTDSAVSRELSGSMPGMDVRLSGRAHAPVFLLRSDYLMGVDENRRRFTAKLQHTAKQLGFRYKHGSLDQTDWSYVLEDRQGGLGHVVIKLRPEKD